MTDQPHKFSNPLKTAQGEDRAWVAPTVLKTLWLNTGTLCNLACANCYIESTPKNDRLVYLTLREVIPYLDEINPRAEAIGSINCIHQNNEKLT